MTKRKPEDISRRAFIGATIGTVVAASAGCGSPDGGPGQASGSGGDATGGRGPSDEVGGARGGSTGPGGTPGAGGAAGQGTGGSSAQQGGSSTQGGRGGGAAAGGDTHEQDGGTSGGSAKGGNSNRGGGSGVAGSNRGGATGVGGSNRGGSTGVGGQVDGGTPGAGGSGGGGSGGTALVSLVRGTDWVQATMDAIALAGGLPDLSGKTVLLKPNIISASQNATTSKDVIQGVIRAAKAKNAGKVIVAEAGWGSGVDVIASMKTLGIYDMCTAEGAVAMDLAKQAHTTRTHASASAFPSGVDFSDDVYKADYVINVPVCKSHGMAKFTMALKAWYGCTQNGRLHGNTWVAPAELHLLKQEDFVVLDATKTMITGGPDSGTMKESKIVVASKDAIAADVTGLCIHKYNGGTILSAKGDAWKIHQIKRALALKFPGWLSTPEAFAYEQQGVTEHAEIMDWRQV